MTADVVLLQTVTSLPLPADRVLDQAPRDMQSVVICGYDKDGDFYFAANIADGGDVLWLLETARLRLMQAGGVLPERVD